MYINRFDTDALTKCSEQVHDLLVLRLPYYTPKTDKEHLCMLMIDTVHTIEALQQNKMFSNCDVTSDDDWRYKQIINSYRDDQFEYCYANFIAGTVESYFAITVLRLLDICYTTYANDMQWKYINELPRDHWSLQDCLYYFATDVVKCISRLSLATAIYYMYKVADKFDINLNAFIQIELRKLTLQAKEQAKVD